MSVVTYPEAEEFFGASVKPHRVRLAEHGTAIRELRNGIEIEKDDLAIEVTAESRREFPITIAPGPLPVLPAFPLEWVFGPFDSEPLVLMVVLSGQGYEFDPSKFVIVQGERQIEPTNVTGTSSTVRLEYDTRSWDFILHLRGITGPSGEMALPEVRFSRSSVWVYGMAP